MSKIVKVASCNFNEEVKSKSGLVLVDFYANWCNPCKMLSPILEEISMEDSTKICKLDVEDSQDIAAQFKVRGIPTMILFRDGEKVDEVVGYRGKEEILEFLKKHK